MSEKERGEWVSRGTLHSITVEKLKLESQLRSLQKQLEDARPVLEYVSRGRGFVGVEPYPDAIARRVLGEMNDEALSPIDPPLAPKEKE